MCILRSVHTRAARWVCALFHARYLLKHVYLHTRKRATLCGGAAEKLRIMTLCAQLQSTTTSMRQRGEGKWEKQEKFELNPCDTLQRRALSCSGTAEVELCGIINNMSENLNSAWSKRARSGRERKGETTQHTTSGNFYHFTSTFNLVEFALLAQAFSTFSFCPFFYFQPLSLYCCETFMFVEHSGSV